MTGLVLDDNARLGRVVSVNTGSAQIAVENTSLTPRAAVGSLVAIDGSTPFEFLIGMTDQVTRNLRNYPGEPDPLHPAALATQTQPDDTLRVILVGTYQTVAGKARNIFKRGADTYPQIDRSCFLLEAGNLQRFMSTLTTDLAPSERLELGHFVLDKSAAAIANGDRLFQRHAAILGSTGSGKSWTVALLLERSHTRRYANIIVLDIHGEYEPLTTPSTTEDSLAPTGTLYKVAGPADIDTPTTKTLFLPYWLLNREEMLSMILDRSDQNAPNQASRFTTHVRDLKRAALEKAGKTTLLPTFTVESPIPYALDDLVQRLRTDDTAKGQGKTGPVKGEWEGHLTRFISRLQAKMDDRRYAFMFKPPKEALTHDWLAAQTTRLLGADKTTPGIKVIDLSDVPSDILPVVTAVLARHLYDVQVWMQPEERTPFALVCDEAHLYLPVKTDADAVEREALATFERIAKEGRKYGVALLVVSQRPSDVSRAILSQCNNFMIFRLTNTEDQATVRRLVPDTLVGLLDALPLLDTGEAFLLGDAILLPARVRMTAPQRKPLSATHDFWQKWQTCPREAPGISNAIEALRRQSRIART